MRWNRGDLEGFMAGYWKSPDLVFFSKRNGDSRLAADTWTGIARAYQGEGKQMGTLDFHAARPRDAGPGSSTGARTMAAEDVRW